MSDTEYDEPKKKHPLDALPKSKMSLDALKRGYNDHKKTDKKYFLSKPFGEEFDDIGYSLYRSDYKHNGDFTGRADFVNRNSVNGMVQSLDDARKYAFGTLSILDVDGEKKQIVGYWILRGSQPIKDVFDDFLDDNVWTQLTPSKETYEKLNEAFYGDKVNGFDVEHRSVFL